MSDNEKNTHLPTARVDEAEIEALALRKYKERKAAEVADELEAQERKLEREAAWEDTKQSTKRLFRAIGKSPKVAAKATKDWATEVKDELAERREEARVAARAERLHQERVMEELRAEAKAELEEERLAKELKKQRENEAS